jgi:hypothetical protein
MLDKTYDPWAAASDPKVGGGASDFWGQVSVNVWPCALVKGVGKEPFDPLKHKIRNTAIDLVINPIIDQPVTNARACERHLIAESKDWAAITWASLKELGINGLREISGKWAHVTTRETGQTYEKDGQTRSKTEFWFVSLFNTEAECVADSQAANGGSAPAAVQPPAAMSGNGNGSNPEKATAEKFLKVVVENACRGAISLEDARANVAAKIAQMPMLAKHFTVDSPEVINLMMSVKA